MKLNRTPCLAAAFLLAALSARALDFGLALNQELRTSNETADAAFFCGPALNPWVSGPLGDAFHLHLSGKISFEYSGVPEGESAWREPAALPELERSELIWLVSPSLSLGLGRRRLQDPAGLAASGLFDGLGAAFSAGGSRFSAGFWYTGLLYKNAADIVMTDRDREEYLKPPALDGTYFASRRVLVSFEWENPGLGPRSSLALGALGQFDVNGGDERLHSQYLSARYGLRLSAGAGLEAAAVLGAGEAGGGDAGVFFAGLLGWNQALPGGPDDRVSVRVLYSSPSNGERLFAFTPVNSLPQGRVFSPALSGLSSVRAAYGLRPRPVLFLEAEFSWFIRTDTVSFQDGREPERLKGEGYNLGGEFFCTARWTPLPDLALDLGGGAFFPGPGDAFEPEAGIRWKAVLELVLSF
ncbi:MAG: hypothetical protein LBP23_08145 [Treponema sp.]|nr:hypothetical protein [Treponema sp.]